MSDITKLKTPCYIIDEQKFIKNFNVIKQAFCREYSNNLVLGYSIKTNHNPHIMQLARKLGMFAEAVSADEYGFSLSCGFSPDNIIFNGPQKSDSALAYALKHGSVVNLDNMTEIEYIKENAELSTSEIRVGLRINFDLESECPGETTAGKEVSRFGFCEENGTLDSAVAELKKLGIAVAGLHMHYSSVTRSAEIFGALARKASDIIKKYLLSDSLEFVDIGGGFFMGETMSFPGKPTMDEYAKTICRALGETVDTGKVKLIIEPGASLIASSAKYVCKVINVREIRNTRVLTTDGSILDINPFMADRVPLADIIRSDHSERPNIEKQIICGNTCMENDRLLYLNNEAAVKSGDCISFRCAGAYTMGFNNCFINLPPYVYIKRGRDFLLNRDKNSFGMFLI